MIDKNKIDRKILARGQNLSEQHPVQEGVLDAISSYFTPPSHVTQRADMAQTTTTNRPDMAPTATTNRPDMRLGSPMNTGIPGQGQGAITGGNRVTPPNQGVQVARGPRPTPPSSVQVARGPKPNMPSSSSRMQLGRTAPNMSTGDLIQNKLAGNLEESSHLRKLVRQIVSEQDVSDDEIKKMADYVYKNKNDPEFTKNAPQLPYAWNSGQVESGLRKKLTDPSVDPAVRQKTIDRIREKMGTTAAPVAKTEPAKTAAATPTSTPQKVADTITKTMPAKNGSWADTRANLGFSAKDSVSSDPKLLAAYNAWSEKN